MAELLGTDNLKSLINLGCKWTKQIFESAKDGWQLSDAISFWDELTLIPGAVKAIKSGAIKAEIKDLSSEERTALNAHFKLEFDIPNDKVEGLVEDSIAWVESTVNLIDRWKKVDEDEAADAEPS